VLCPPSLRAPESWDGRFHWQASSLTRDQFHLQQLPSRFKSNSGFFECASCHRSFCGWISDSTEPQFLAVTPTGITTTHDDCAVVFFCLSITLGPEFRRNVTAHTSARVPVVVHSLHGYVPVNGTQVSLSNGGRVFGGRTRGTLRWI